MSEAAAHERNPPSARRYLVVWNRSAGSKAGISTNHVGEADLRRVMSTHGLGTDLFAGATEAEAIERIRRAVADGTDVIVAAGGDGTVDLVAGIARGTGSAVGILPLGSAMNIARSLGIPRDLEQAAALLSAGEIATIDVGHAEDGPFYEMASVGMSAALLADAHRIAEGEYRSIGGLIRSILRYRPTRMTIELDDRVLRTGALMVAVANAPFTGAGLTLAPDARLDDGLFDVAIFRRFSRLELLRHLGGIVAGRRRYSPKVTTHRSSTVRVSARRPLPARVDARGLGTTPVRFEVEPRALRVVVAARGQRAAPTDGGPAIAPR